MNMNNFVTNKGALLTNKGRRKDAHEDEDEDEDEDEERHAYQAQKADMRAFLARHPYQA